MIPYKYREILRCAQNDNLVHCHSERSEESAHSPTTDSSLRSE